MTATIEFTTPEAIEEMTLSILKKHDLLGTVSTAVNPVAVANGEGIEVFSVDLADDSVCGILRKEQGRFRLYVNRDHSGNRIRYTIAHELGHFFLHGHVLDAFVDQEINLFRNKTDPASKLHADMEIQANMFAAALLMPAVSVRRWYQHESDISILAKRFGVSREAMGQRIDNLGL